MALFANLTERLSKITANIRGRGRLSEDNISDALREVRTALLEADVALPVVDEFLDRVRLRAVGQEVIGNLTPGQALVRVVRDELTMLMGSDQAELNLKAEPPAVILLVGLQGAGKTTTAAKLARFLMNKHRKSVALVSCDVYRPAAIEQLQIVGEEVGATVLPSSAGSEPVGIASAAHKEAAKQFKDVLIVDTAGRLHIDEEMMREIEILHQTLGPVETLFVIDAMMGQDAVNTAKAFNDMIPLTGVILTKADGDARGGAALSVRQVTGAPIKFLGVGERTEALEAFFPARMASRMLGMGDVLGLIEEVEEKVDRDKAEKIARKLQKGTGFDLVDFRDQLHQMQSMGGLSSVMEKMPGVPQMPARAAGQFDDKELTKLGAIVDSMTVQERHFPAVIKASRKKRIASGSGTQVQDVNRLLKQFTQMQKMMKKMSRKGGMQKLMRGLHGQMKGQM